MDDLDFPDRHHAVAAEGWLELGNTGEAAAELNRVSPSVLEGHPDLLDLRWRLLAFQKRWEEALEVSRTLTRLAPDLVDAWVHQSFTLHELRRTREAWTALSSVASRFPKESIIPYNLACYACQLGDLPAARTWIIEAARLRSKEEIREMGLSDPDLEPLREFLEGI